MVFLVWAKHRWCYSGQFSFGEIRAARQIYSKDGCENHRETCHDLSAKNLTDNMYGTHATGFQWILVFTKKLKKCLIFGLLLKLKVTKWTYLRLTESTRICSDMIPCGPTGFLCQYVRMCLHTWVNTHAEHIKPHSIIQRYSSIISILWTANRKSGSLACDLNLVSHPWDVHKELPSLASGYSCHLRTLGKTPRILQEFIF